MINVMRLAPFVKTLPITASFVRLGPIESMIISASKCVQRATLEMMKAGCVYMNPQRMSVLPSPERTAHGISTSTSITKLAMNATLVARRATASMKLTALHALGADTYGSKKHQASIGSVFHAILLPCYMALQEIA